MKTKIILFVLTLSVMSSCKNEVSTIAELHHYINDSNNGLIYKVNKGELDYTLIVQPSWLVMHRDIQYTNIYETENKTQYDSLIYFLLQISDKGKSIESKLVHNQQRINEITNYLSSGIIEDLFIINGNDTIRPLDVIYSGNISMTGVTEVLAVFSTSTSLSSEHINFFFEDNLTYSGRCEFKFQTNDIRKIPKVN